VAPSTLTQNPAGGIKRRSDVPLTPVRKLSALAIIMFVALVFCSRSPRGTAGLFFLPPLAIAATAYLLALREFMPTERYPRHIPAGNKTKRLFENGSRLLGLDFRI
jgi:hypothetical protein